MRDQLARRRTFGIILVLAVAAVVGMAALAVAGPAAAQQDSGVTEVDSCRVIATPGKYRLTQDIETSADRCIEITGSEVIFDGNNHSIVGPDEDRTVGIDVGPAVEGNSEPLEYVRVKNVRVRQFDTGILFERTEGVWISRATAENNSRGIDFGGVKTGRIDTSRTVSNSDDGIRLDGSVDIEIEANTIDEPGIGILVKGRSKSNGIKENRIAASGSGVVVREQANETNINGNNISGNGRAGVRSSGAAPSINNNRITGMSNGIVIDGGSGLKSVEGNVIEDAPVVGVAVNASWTFILENRISGTGVGIGLRVANDTTIQRNRITGHTTGLAISGPSSRNSVSNNIFANENNILLSLDYDGRDNDFSRDRESGPNIVGGPVVAGNYYTNLSGGGFSRACEDEDGDGICDSPNRFEKFGPNPEPGESDARPLAAPCGVPAVVGDGPPSDPDRDYKCEDVNGDGEVSVVDVQAAFANREAIRERSDSEAFDYNGDGEIDPVDIQRLFREIARSR